MSDLPPFDPATGYLPPGWHFATTETLKGRCVTPFIHPQKAPNTKIPGKVEASMRATLFDGYMKLYAALELLGIPTEQWVGGPFVSHHPRPPAVDVVNFCDAHVFESLPTDLRALVLNYFNGQETAAHCHCDSHLVTKGPPDHPCNAEYLKMHNFWHRLLGHDHVGRPKGIVGITIEPPPPSPGNDDESAA